MKPSLKNEPIEEYLISFFLFLDEDWKNFDDYAKEVALKEKLILKVNPIEAVVDPKISGSFFQSGRTIAYDKSEGKFIIVFHLGQVLGIITISRDLHKAVKKMPPTIYFRDRILLREWNVLPKIEKSEQCWRLDWGILRDCQNRSYSWIIDSKHNDQVVLENLFEKWWLIEFIIINAAILNLTKDIEYITNPSRLYIIDNGNRILKYKFGILKRHIKLFESFITRNNYNSISSLPVTLSNSWNKAEKNCKELLATAGIEIKSKIPRIFISSTRGGLDFARSLVRDSLLANGFFPEMMENFPSEDLKSKEACLKYVAQCDGLILLLGSRFGWRPPGNGKCSITKFEWLEADRLNLSRAAVLFEEDATPKELTIEDDIGKRELEKWKKQIKKNLSIIVSRKNDYSWVNRLIASVHKFGI